MMLSQKALATTKCRLSYVIPPIQLTTFQEVTCTLYFHTGSSAPPQNVKTSVQTSTAIFVSWNPITNCSDINGNITGWLVRYSDSNNYTQLIPGSNQESGNTTLVGLLFHTTYWIQVAAVNSDGHIGVFSEPIMSTTMENRKKVLT